MGKPKIKPNYRRRSLRLPDLDHCKRAVLNSLGSPASRRVYEYAIDQFIAWYCSEPRLALNRIVVVRYRMYLESRGLAANTINQQLAAVRRLAHEATDAGLLSPELAAGISRVKGVKQLPKATVPGACDRELRTPSPGDSQGSRRTHRQDLPVLHLVLHCRERPVVGDLAPPARRGETYDPTAMKYCYNCNRITIGEPLFCNFCGRSYDVKLCPKLHVNPRYAQVCSACGNRDLTTPQPKVPFWAKMLLFLLTLIPGAIISFISILLIIVFIERFFGKQDMVMGLALIEFILGALWWGWTEIPLQFRKTIHRWLKRHDRDPENSDPPR